MAIQETDIDDILNKLKDTITFEATFIPAIRQYVREAIGVMQDEGINDDRILTDLGTAVIREIVNTMWRVGGTWELSPTIDRAMSRLYSASRLDDSEV